MSEQINQSSLPEQNRKKMYRAVLYARLSVFDQKKKGDSIASQIVSMRQFAANNLDMEEVAVCSDCGKSGMNFNREGFEQLMKLLKSGKADCVVVRDLSRLGRNYLETGEYMEKIFPLMGVRLVSLMEGYDSSQSRSRQDILSCQLHNLVNELYAREASRKITKAKKLLAEQGNYMGGKAPYGYRIIYREGKRTLEIEEDTAAVVRQLFCWFAAGESGHHICDHLYSQKIQPPILYQKSGQVYAVTEPVRRWSEATLCQMRHNPVYTGYLITGRKFDEHSSKEELHAKENRQICLQTHPAIVEADIYEQAQRRKTRTRTSGM